MRRAGNWWAPRDGVTSTRGAGGLIFVGAIYMFFYPLLVPASLNGVPGAMAVSAVCAGVLAALSIVPLWAPHRAPSWAAALLAGVGLVEIFVLDVITVDASFSAQVFLGWPALYAAYHLPRGPAWVLTIASLAAQVVLLLHVGGLALVHRDTPAWAMTFAVVTWLISTGRDRQAATLESLHAEATQDALTGLATRRAFDRALQQHLRRGTVGALVLVDVDRFKQINDQHGHGFGDAVLREVAAQLRAACRAGDVVARLGGDELAALVLDEAPPAPGSPETTGPVARRAAERFRRAVAGACVLLPDGSPGPRLSVSVGLADGRPGEGSELLLARADAALYAAKRAGRDRVACDGEPCEGDLPAVPPRAPPGGAGPGAPAACAVRAGQ